MKKAKITTNFVCQECGYDTTSWLGKCPECGSWNSLKEFQTTNREQRTKNSGISLENAKPQKLNEIVYKEKSRIQTDFEELNTVLGGGIVHGSVTLIAGDPGVGKSTLLLQLALQLSNEKKVLYISGEESSDQVKMRAERIYSSSERKRVEKPFDKLRTERFSTSSNNKSGDNLFLLSLTDSDAIVSQIEDLKPQLVIVDSIQTVESQNVSGLAGSVGQIRYSALQLVRCAKQNNIPIIIVGHVTKEGMVAGPMILSHMVDTVLFLEGEKNTTTRILRSLKNRFGPVDEVGIFVMEESGMIEAANPEMLFLGNSSTPPFRQGFEGQAGSVLVVTLEGSRAFIVELQALAVNSALPMPRRVVSGVDPKRVELLLAVLQKHARLPVDRMDIFVNIAGGLKITDPAIDLGVCLAIYSSLKNVVLSNTVGISEVGLLGELRSVSGLEKRIKESQKLGFKNIITAKSHRSLREVIESVGKGK